MKKLLNEERTHQLADPPLYDDGSTGGLQDLRAFQAARIEKENPRRRLPLRSKDAKG